MEKRVFIEHTCKTTHEALHSETAQKIFLILCNNVDGKEIILEDEISKWFNGEGSILIIEILFRLIKEETGIGRNYNRLLDLLQLNNNDLVSPYSIVNYLIKVDGIDCIEDIEFYACKNNYPQGILTDNNGNKYNFSFNKEEKVFKKDLNNNGKAFTIDSLY